MTKIRVLFFFLTIIVVGSLAYLAGLYARGFRFDLKNKRVTEGGLLVAKSVPDGAFILVNGAILSATNDNISLPPGQYDIEVKKDGYTTWSKKVTVEKEIVTEIEAYLFKKAPTLTPITIYGAANPSVSTDLTKLIYTVPATSENLSQSKAGLWVMDNYNNPLTFGKDPKMISAGNFDKASQAFSPDGTKVYVDATFGKFIIPTNALSTVNSRTLTGVDPYSANGEWKKEIDATNALLVKNLPSVLSVFLTENANYLSFSPDKNKILYTVGKKATLAPNIISPFPGASTQPESRDVQENTYYVYDIKEDKNFAVGQVSKDATLTWFPTSKHLFLADPSGVYVMDYDGTVKQAIYNGSYVAPFAFPAVNSDRIIILTNFGSTDSPANLYSVGIR